MFSKFSIIARPAVAVMNRLRYARKFVFIAIALLLPFGYTAYLQFRGATTSIQFNDKERIGVTYITAAKDLLRSLERARILTVAHLTNNTGLDDQLSLTLAQADREAGVLDTVDAEYGAALSTTVKWAEIRGDWKLVHAQKFTSAADADTAYGTLTGKVTDLILNYAGNNSNLILDPDLDSYWLMDAWTAKMPNIGQGVSTLAANALMPRAEGDLERPINLAGTQSALLGTLSDLTTVNLATAFKETKDRQLESALRPTTEATSKALTAFAQLARKEFIVAPQPAAGSAKALIDQALAAIDQSYEQYKQIGPLLDRLIAARVAGFVADRRLGLIATGLALVVLAYLFAGFYLSVRTSVSALAAATGRMIAGTNETFQLDARDEIGDIALAYNQINSALVEARTLKDKVENDNHELQANVVGLLEVVSQASDGDLTVRATIGTGALGNVCDAFNQLLESLSDVLRDVHGQLDHTTNVVGQIRTASEQMTTGAGNQATELRSATRLVDVMSAQIANVSQIAENAADAARRAKDSAAEGSGAVQNVVSGMQSLRTNVQAGAKKMKNLGERSMEITHIVSTIQRISEQTNMLALNAAIEAARAGEHGRGFSIVADEVRKLAERTAGATDEIGKLVKAIHAETAETVQAIEQQTHVVEEEASVVGTAGDSLSRILEVSNESFSLVSSIRNVAADQVAGTKEVVSTIEQISEIAQRTQDGALNNLTIIDQLVSQSNRLSATVRRFRV